jgi:hypothetical protein
MAPLVKSGAKEQTVRLRPKRMPFVGETISCRAWTGKPYRSKQERLGDFTIKRVASITIRLLPYGELVIIVDGEIIGDILSFARADGFESPRDMRQEFERMGELPLKNGIVIYW